MAAAATGHLDVPAVELRPVSSSSPLARLLITSPDLVAVGLAGFSLGPMILLLAGHFTMTPVLVTGLLGAAVALWMRGIDVSVPDRRSVVCTAIAAGIALVWFLANVAYTGQNVYATRDPATYNITARWLMDNATLHIPTHPEIFGAPVGSFNGGAGFSPVNTAQVYSQGNHLMPALAAVGGWLFGVQGMFRVNLVLGALALFVFFGLVRRVAGAPLALLAMVVMAVSMPMIYVSRDMYSEPLMMLFLMGAVGLLYRAIGTGRVRDFALAGFVAGCSAMVRIDAYGALLSIILAAVIVTGVAAVGARRAATIRSSVLLGACAVPTLVGWLDVTRLSYGYYRDQRGNILLEVKGAAALTVVGLVAIAFLWRPRVRTWLAAQRTRRRLDRTLAGLLVAFVLVLASRPLWQITRGTVDNPTLAIWQTESHVTVDGTRLYNETTLREVGAYFGWVTIVLGVLGYVILLRAMIQRRDYRLLGILGMGLTMSGLYLWNWEITPDQPWAMRRFVPVVIPIMLLAAVVGLKALWRLRPATPRGRQAVRVVGVLAAVAMVAIPAVVSFPMRTVREEVPQYEQVQAICAAVGHNGAVVEVDMDSEYAYGQTMRSYCGVPSIGLVPTTAAQQAQLPAQLARMNATVAAHGRQLFVLSQDVTKMPFEPGSSTAPFSSVIVQRWPDKIGDPPTKKGGRATQIYLGTVGPGGEVRPLAAH